MQLKKNVIDIGEYRKRRALSKLASNQVSSSESFYSPEARIRRIYEKIAKIQFLMKEIKKSTFLKK